MPHTQQKAKKSASGTMRDAAKGGTNAFSRMSAGTQAARASTLAKSVPNDLELQRALTPLRHSQFERELVNHPDKAWTHWLLNGIKNGVALGYDGPRGPREARNLISASQHTHVIDEELRKECLAGRILGPFPARPIENLKCSGLGAVPKKGGKWRMILHLSAPLGQSINDYISKEEFSLRYSSIDDATRMLSALGKGSLMAKVDLKSAFRMVPVRRQDWELLGMKWKEAYFVDTCLPFGLRSAPYLFNQFAEALQWILQHNYGLQWLIHYLDDYLIVGAPDSHSCGEHLQTFLRACTLLGIPVAMDKVDGPATVLSFLGLELDSVLQQIRLPPNKLEEILAELTEWQSRNKTTKRKLLSLIGKLAFAARAVPAGRFFIRRLITLSTKAKKLHHHVRLNNDARADIAWWQEFLPTWNGTAQFIDQQPTDAADLELYTDASGRHGCGAYFQGEWFHHEWQPHQQLSKCVSIQWQELFAIVAAALTWGHNWRQKRIRFYCDNLAIVNSWEGKSSKHPRIMSLLRTLFLIAAKNNFTVSLKHLPGKANEIADALSRKQFTRFFHLAPQAQQLPTPTPGMLRVL